MADIVVKEKKPDQNMVRFCGVIIWKQESATKMTITVRVTTKEGNRTYTNYPRLSVFNEDLKAQINALPLRVPVVVEGYVTSTKQRRDENGALIPFPENTPIQSFVAESVRLAEEGEPESNEITVVGSVEAAFVSKNGNINFVIVSFRDGRYMKRIRMGAFRRSDVDYLSMMAAGTRVQAIGHCSTFTAETRDGDRVPREYLVIDQIEKA